MTHFKNTTNSAYLTHKNNLNCRMKQTKLHSLTKQLTVKTKLSVFCFIYNKNLLIQQFLRAY